MRSSQALASMARRRCWIATGPADAGRPRSGPLRSPALVRGAPIPSLGPSHARSLEPCIARLEGVSFKPFLSPTDPR